MKVLVVGGGGREHAIAWAVARSNSVSQVFAAPGNPGIERVAKCVAVRADDPAAVAALADDVDADLTIVGPEAPLVAGVVDAVEARGRRAFGPSAAAARLEGSKAWMKEIVAAAGVPSARYGAFDATREDEALVFLESLPGLYVVKTDGLAAGKGVVVTESLSEAREAVRSYLSGEAFGDAGRSLVIEEGLSGPELSLLVLCDGNEALPLQPAQDFKRIDDGDQGPNTGGMGAYSPVPIAGAGVVDEIMARAVRPTLDELARRGVEYRGVLYAGIMMTGDGPKILEYNCRFGDPECQVILPRLDDDLAEICAQAASGRLEIAPDFRDDAAVCVVLSSPGYPVAPRAGDLIDGLADAEALPGVNVFHAGTAWRDGSIVTAGGRVLGVTATAESIAAARELAYRASDMISWPGVHRRSDIARDAAQAAVTAR